MSTDKSPLMLVVAGFFGSLIAVGRASHGNLRDNLLAISAGTSSAYFLTPCPPYPHPSIIVFSRDAR